MTRDPDRAAPTPKNGHLVAARRSDRAQGGRAVEMHVEPVDRSGMRTDGEDRRRDQRLQGGDGERGRNTCSRRRWSYVRRCCAVAEIAGVISGGWRSGSPEQVKRVPESSVISSVAQLRTRLFGMSWRSARSGPARGACKIGRTERARELERPVARVTMDACPKSPR